MGNCSSSDSGHVSTSKLILQDGRLQEFSYPIKVSFVLQKNPSCFICNSDEMDFDDVLSAVDTDEELQMGQLYFALRLSWLKHPLPAEDMAALAVKASSALMKNGVGEKCGPHRRAASPVTPSGEEMRTSRRDGSGGGRRGRRLFIANLSAIPE